MVLRHTSKVEEKVYYKKPQSIVNVGCNMMMDLLAYHLYFLHHLLLSGCTLHFNMYSGDDNVIQH